MRTRQLATQASGSLLKTAVGQGTAALGGRTTGAKEINKGEKREGEGPLSFLFGWPCLASPSHRAPNKSKPGQNLRETSPFAQSLSVSPKLISF